MFGTVKGWLKYSFIITVKKKLKDLNIKVIKKLKKYIDTFY